MVTCPICGGSYKNQHGLSIHIGKMHKNSAGAATRQPPPSSSYRGVTSETPEDVTCDICGRGGFKGDHGLSIHIGKMHGAGAGYDRVQSSPRAPPDEDVRKEVVRKSPEPSCSELEVVDVYLNQMKRNKETGKPCVKEERLSHDEGSPERHVALDQSRKTELTDGIKLETLHVNPSKIRQSRPDHLADLATDACPLCPYTSTDEKALLKHLEKVHIENMPDSCLRQEMKKLSLSQAEVSEQADILNGIIDGLFELFGKEWEIENVGSYYDRTKINNPDEFDVMFVRPVDCKVHLIEGSHFCRLEPLYPYNLPQSWLTRDENKTWLCPKAFKAHFAELIQKDKYTADLRDPRRSLRNVGIKPDPKLLSPSVEISIERPPYKDGLRPTERTRPTVDLVPAIEPTGWLFGDSYCTWVAKRHREEDLPEYYHAVAKIHPSERNKEKNNCSLWRLSFSIMEKSLIFHADGTFSSDSFKTCRKSIHKKLKDDLETLKGRRKLHTFSSYHIKSIMLGLFNKYHKHTQWKEDKFLLRYIHALAIWKRCLEKGYIPHAFIPGDNLLKEMVSTPNGSEEQDFLLKKVQTIIEALKLKMAYS